MSKNAQRYNRNKEIKLMHDIGRPDKELATYYDLTEDQIRRIITVEEENEEENES
jgi:Mor family transcriptional regulator